MMHNVAKKIYWGINKHDSYLASHLWYAIERQINPIQYIPEHKELADIHKWVHLLPKDIDAVVGIPRRGLLYANLIAMELGKPLSTPDKLMRGEFWMSAQNPVNKLFSYNKILLVDDSTETGKQMIATSEMLQKAFPGLVIKTAVLYLGPYRKIDYYYYKIPKRLGTEYEIALMHGGCGRHPLGTDLDGVLCNDVPEGISDEEHYRKALAYRIPKGKIEFIATGRLEEYRRDTELWLDEHNVNYDNLYMRKSKSQNPAIFKSSIIKREKPKWFWESSASEARIIRLFTGGRVIVFGQ